jgi:hypothetical protein
MQFYQITLREEIVWPIALDSQSNYYYYHYYLMRGIKEKVKSNAIEGEYDQKSSLSPSLCRAGHVVGKLCSLIRLILVSVDVNSMEIMS